MIRRRFAGAAAVLTLAVGLAGCSNDSLASQYRSGDGKGYISGDGTVTTIPLADRGDPVDFAGRTVDGSRFDSADDAGDVTVVNFWYASCGPCRLEAKDLETISGEYDGRSVRFVGVNTHDTATTARSFEADFGVTYPSILDADDGAVQLAFSGSVPPKGTPTTLVLDERGRVAARIVGPVSEQPSTLTTLIDDTLAEKGSA